MVRMGFDGLWTEWMHECSTAHVSVLVNGSPTNSFPMERGDRQGDPLSPFLFLLAAEGLKCILDKASEVGLLHGIHLGNLGSDFSLLQFADDILIFVPDEVEMINNLKREFRCFEVISGLRTNFKKSSLAGLNVDDLLLSNAAMVLECKTENYP